MTTAPVVALLPMKAHSERVPNKNIRPCAGKPLYQHVLSQLDRCADISAIVINTDSAHIAAEAPTLSPKVRIHHRPAALCGDLIPMNDIIAHDLAALPETEHFLQTHSTNPLLSSETIQRALRAYFNDGAQYDSLFSVTVHHARFYDAAGQPINHDPAQLLRTQDLPPVYEENSNLYLFSREVFATRRNRIGARPQLFPTPPLEALDIDTESDFLLAETLCTSSLQSAGAQV